MTWLFGDKKFLNTVLKLATPIMLQNLIFASLNMVDGVMIGQLGESAVAAVGVANQVFFLVSLLFFGIGSGTAIFAAQFWGKKDIRRIQSVLGFKSVDEHQRGCYIFSGGHPVPGPGDKYLLQRSGCDLPGQYLFTNRCLQLCDHCHYKQLHFCAAQY